MRMLSLHMSRFSQCFLVSGRDRNAVKHKQKQKEANCLPQEQQQEGSQSFAGKLYLPLKAGKMALSQKNVT